MHSSLSFRLQRRAFIALALATPFFIAAPRSFAQPKIEAQTASKVAAELGLPALFADGMVLQRGIEVPFWGTTAPGQKVTVTLGQQVVSTVAGADGAWRLKLAPLEAGGPYEITVFGKNNLVLHDVLVGDVWIASGQSNMAFQLSSAKNSASEIAAAGDASLRMFAVKKNPNFDTPQKELGGSWLVSNSQNAGNFSAVAYFFARELRHELGVPIGITNSSWGGTPAQAWTSHDVLQNSAVLKPLVTEWQKTLATYPTAKSNMIRTSRSGKPRRKKLRPKARRAARPDLCQSAIGLV